MLENNNSRYVIGKPIQIIGITRLSQFPKQK